MLGSESGSGLENGRTFGKLGRENIARLEPTSTALSLEIRHAWINPDRDVDSSIFGWPRTEESGEFRPFFPKRVEENE